MSFSEKTFRTFTQDNPNFVLIVEGEVADNFSFPVFPDGSIPPAIEKLIAVLKSNPVVIETLDPVEPGSTWDGSSFIPPVD